ncbi:MAG: hypothetical protein ABIK89_16095, partial [Planctomycetota bacterium]
MVVAAGESVFVMQRVEVLFADHQRVARPISDIGHGNAAAVVADAVEPQAAGVDPGGSLATARLAWGKLIPLGGLRQAGRAEYHAVNVP